MLTEFSLKIQLYCPGRCGVKVKGRNFQTKVFYKIEKVTFL